MAIFNSYVCLPEGSGIDKWFIVSAQLSGFWYSCGFRATEKKWLEKNTPSYRNLNKENEVFDLKVWGTHQFIWASSWNVSDDRSLKLQETRLQKQHASHLNHLKSLTIDCWLVGQKPSPNDFCTWTLHLVSDYKPWLSLNVSRRFFLSLNSVPVSHHQVIVWKFRVLNFVPHPGCFWTIHGYEPQHP